MRKLEWLENWYRKNCDGSWEHTYGIEIGTLDNPGWYVKIDLSETQYQNIQMEEIVQEQGDRDWMRCMIADKTFQGFGDSLKLNAILQVFQNVIERE